MDHTVQHSNCPHTPSEIAVFADFIWTELVHKDPEFEIRIKSPTASKDKKNSKKNSTSKHKTICSFNTYEHIFLFMIHLENSLF